MKALPLMAAAVALTSLAACANDPAPTSASAPVSSSDPLGTSMLTPQPPNSLPPGAAVNAPLTAPTGDVATTAVGRGATRR